MLVVDLSPGSLPWGGNVGDSAGSPAAPTPSTLSPAGRPFVPVLFRYFRLLFTAVVHMYNVLYRFLMSGPITVFTSLMVPLVLGVLTLK